MDFEGNHVVYFTNGKVIVVDVEANIMNGDAQPLYLKSVTGELYNWQNIISVKKVDD